jgi:ribosome-associated toxin RatA of RatAB toxin-antitoxin module
VRQLHKSLFMPFSAAQMFAIVNDIDRYGQFLPWCGGARVIHADADVLTAEIVIAKGPVRVAFTTHNRIALNERIDMRLAQGPFKHLTGAWVFEPKGEQACQVRLQMDFEFNNRLLSMTVGPVFEQVVGSLIDAFRQRAQVLYVEQY